MHHVLLLFLLVSLKTVAQSNLTQTTRDRINFSGLNIPSTGTMYGMAGEAGQLIGTNYLDSTWQAGTVTFYSRMTPTSDSLAGIPIRYDLKSTDLEIRAKPNDIRVAKAPSVRRFRVNNSEGGVSQFINVHEFGGDADKLKGYFEQLNTGKLTLLRYPSLYLKRANYNVALNTGSKDDVLLPKTDWYVARNRTATSFSPSRKSVLSLMADKKDAVDSFMKTNDLDPKTSDGLVAIFDYYNQLP